MDRKAREKEARYAFLSGGGEAAEIIAGFDWAATPLGPVADWPDVLKTTISIILRSPVPIVTLWGAEGIMIYNDAYSVFAGGRHPVLFGSKVREGWPEVADFNDNVMKVGLAGGTLAYRDQELTLLRSGIPEQVWMNLDYSPILDGSGNPVGVMAIVVETTDKIRVERQLLAERESLRDLFEQAPGAIAVLTGPDHVFTMTNAAYQRLVGDRPVLGKSVREALPEVEVQGFIELLDTVVESGKPYVGEGIRIVLSQSDDMPAEERFADFVYQPIRASDGSVSGIFIQGTDVTASKLAEAALRESEERFRLVAERAPVMLWMGDAEGKCLYLNKEQRDFWGVAPEVIEGFDWTDTVHPEDREALSAPFAEGMRTRQPFTTEARFRRADGTYRSFLTDARPRFGPRGEFLGMIGVNVDITEIRNAETGLRREKRILEVLNDTGSAIAAELDLEKVVQMVTDAGVELVGAQFGAFFYNVTDAAGDSYMLYTLSGVPREEFAKFPMPRSTDVFRPTFHGEGTVRSPDILKDPRYGRNEPYRGMPEGHLPVRSYLAVPVKSRSGEVIGGLFFGHAEPDRFNAEHETLLSGIAGQAAISIDNAHLFLAAEREIAERRRAEEALQALNATLEQRVSEEVLERSKAEDALRQAQKMEAIGNLTGGVAHDFNNLLQVISGNLQLLVKDVAGNETGQQRIRNALDGVGRGAKLASQLLAFGRRQTLEPKVVNIGKLITTTADMLRRTIGEEIEVETVVSGGLWNTLIDPSQLENALLNLAINARDAMPDSGKLTIEAGNAYLDDVYAQAHPEVSPGQYVILAVTDTGAGMTGEVLQKAFDPFFSTKPQGKGTGLGLSMVYGFVRQSGGHVKIYSEPGHGTSVKIYLPRVRQSEDVMVLNHAGSVTGGNETILVAEDDDEVRLTAVDMLTDLGYRVLTARDAASALSVIESGVPIDLLFTDVVMPGPLKSSDLARKARERLPSLAVLFTSGYTENSITHGGRLDQGVELLSKPYTQQALARKIRHVLANRAHAQADLAAQAPAPGASKAPAASPPADLKVVLCEDEIIIRMTTADLLRAIGYEVFEAGSVEDAHQLCSSEPVDILITDVGLPDGTGIDLARKIREANPSLPIIFATGHDVIEGINDLPHVETVSKPYEIDDIRHRIERLMSSG